ncbi:MAG: site-specific integrase, partial [Bacteroidota bacterium]
MNPKRSRRSSVNAIEPGAAEEIPAAIVEPGEIDVETPAGTTAMVSRASSAVGLVNLRDAWERAEHFAAAATSPNTQRALRSHWNAFASWCDDAGLHPLPADPRTVALYLSAVADLLATGTIARRLWAIKAVHVAAEMDTPTTAQDVRRVWQGIRNIKGVAQAGKRAVFGPELRAMVEGLPATAIGVRDRALLLVGWFGAFRRSELVALDCDDIQPAREGLVITVRRSKTDQTGAGMLKAVPSGIDRETCPVRALRAWLDLASITEGAIFRRVWKGGDVADARLSDRAVARIVKAAAERIGLDVE